jgi:nucleotide-binding universal stress UspA family protein
MKKILVPLDFSEDSAMVARYALDFARAEDARICLMHSAFDRLVIPERTFPGSIETEYYISEQLLKDQQEQAGERLKLQLKLIRKIAREEGISGAVFTTHTGGAEPAFEILEYSAVFLPDLIVMGSSGSGNKGFLEGSVSKRVMNNASVPVLAVSRECDYKRVKNILYMTDFEKADLAAIQSVFRIFGRQPVHISVLHLANEYRMEEAERQMEELRKKFKNEEKKGLIGFFTEKRLDYRKEVLEFISAGDIHLVSFIPHKRNFLEGFFRKVMTKKDLFEAGLPLLAIPANG